MKRKLLKQIRNEWRTNVWLTIELLIVSVVMWYIIDNLYTTFSIMNEPRGFDTEHCYLINSSELTDQSPDYIPDQTQEQRTADLLTFIDRLEKRPEIECVALGQNAYFYNGSNSGTLMTCDTFSTSGAGYFVRRYVSPEFPKVFRIHGANGETPEQLSELLENRRGFLISDNAFKRSYGIENMRDFIGKDFFNGASNDTLRLLGAYVPVRYNDYSALEWAVSMMTAYPKEDYTGLTEIVVRVRDNMDTDFIENLMKDADRHFRIGNYYIASVKTFDDIRYIHQRNESTTTRNYIVGVLFLLLNIFLGLLGTFWFRTQQRVPEIAIRKANGATRTDIFRRVIGEGLILLLIITPVAAAFDWVLVYFEINTYYHGAYFEPIRFITCLLVSFALMALMIIFGILIPANRAMKIAPAKALMDE
ncbi:MAG: ABC transporter permease [Duncaniella sp.]|nr:ABC transporter permease [Duncaniella sp.]